MTTIDKKAQDAAVKAVNEKMPPQYFDQVRRPTPAKALHVGLTAIRPGDGAIVAMYGGKDYSTVQFNASTDATMQGGSTFKVFGLLAALQKDISTKTLYDGYSPRLMPEFVSPSPGMKKGQVTNFGSYPGEQFGRIDLRKALSRTRSTRSSRS